MAAVMFFVAGLLLTLLLTETTTASALHFASSFRLCDRRRIDKIVMNLSGIAVDERSGKLLLVVNKPMRILVYNPATNMVERTAHTDAVNDGEGVTWLGANRVGGAYEFAVVDEQAKTRKIVKDPSSSRIVVFDADTLQVTGETYGVDVDILHNKGLEGLAYDATRERFYAVQEKSPMRVIAIPRGDDREPGGGYETVIDNQTAFRGVGITDLAGATYVVDGGLLLLLSQEQRRLALFDVENGRFLEDEVFDVSGALHPEGVAYDALRGKLYVVGEPNEIFVYCRVVVEKLPEEVVVLEELTNLVSVG